MFVVSFVIFVELVNGRPFAYHYNLMDTSESEINNEIDSNVESAPDDDIKSGELWNILSNAF